MKNIKTSFNFDTKMIPNIFKRISNIRKVYRIIKLITRVLNICRKEPLKKAPMLCKACYITQT